jgi:hypothetical protein
MNLVDQLLKALAEISLVKVNIDKSTKIHIRDGSVSIGEHTITDPEQTNKIKSLITKDVSTHKRDDKLPYQIIHKDILQDYEEYEEISKKNSKSIILLKEVLPSEEVECILTARRVKMALDKKDSNLATELTHHLDENYPKKGKKVLNLIRAGYFDELIIPMIELFKVRYVKDYREKFKEFYSNLLRFFPTAIFVNNKTTEEILEKEIMKRLKLRTIPVIKIHSMGEENIQKAVNVVNKIKNVIKCDIVDNRFISSLGVEAQNLEIRIKKNYF